MMYTLATPFMHSPLTDCTPDATQDACVLLCNVMAAAAEISFSGCAEAGVADCPPSSADTISHSFQVPVKTKLCCICAHSFAERMNVRGTPSPQFWQIVGSDRGRDAAAFTGCGNEDRQYFPIFQRQVLTSAH